MRTIAIINMKGGVGKTVTTIQLASILANLYGKNVALVDCDGQCNLTRTYLPDYQDGDDLSVVDVLENGGECCWSDNMQLVRPRIYLLPASASLYRMDLAALRSGNAGICALKGFVEAMAGDGEVDTVLFDCPPGFTAASTAALMAARELIIPVMMDGFSLEGMSEMVRQVESMRQVNPNLRVAGVLITQWHKSPAVEQGERMLRQLGGLPIFRQVIRRSDKVPESTFVKQPVMDYSWRSAASYDYRALDKEMFGPWEEADNHAV